MQVWLLRIYRLTMFKTCANGHDLTVEGAFYYHPNGNRVCRLCEKPRTRSTRSGSTWHEKRGRTRETFA